MKIVLLGSGAALPTLHRWPTSLAVQRNNEILLFDCGEGAQIRFQQAKLKPGKLSKVFISHFHGDHIYGLIGLLTSFQLAGRTKPLDLFAPAGMTDYLAFMQKLSHFSFQFDIQIHEFQTDNKEPTWTFDDYSVQAARLQHSLFSLGFRLQEKPKPGKFDAIKADELGIPDGPERHQLQNGESIELANGVVIQPADVIGPAQPGLKIAICLDTRPCEASIRLAADVDLLIHEATFLSDMHDLAQQTAHSTTTDAARIAQKAHAKQLLLTHISARYSKQDEATILKQAQSIFPNTVLGKDLMRLNLSSI